MGKRKKRLKKISRRQRLKNWSNEVRSRDGWKCIVCGSEKHTQAHHLILKHLLKALAFEPSLGVTLCPSHHYFSVELSAHGNPIAFNEWLRSNRPVTYAYVLQITAQIAKEKSSEKEEGTTEGNTGGDKQEGNT